MGAAGVTIEDLGSKNGTTARGVRLAGEQPLTDGDQLAFGSIRATFRLVTSDATLTDDDAS